MELYQILLAVFAAVAIGLYMYKRVTGKDLLANVLLSKPVIAA